MLVTAASVIFVLIKITYKKTSGDLLESIIIILIIVAFNFSITTYTTILICSIS